MSFIGIMAESKCYENIKANLIKQINCSKWNIIRINLQSIENIQNIKFDLIVVDSNLERFEDRKELVNKLCNNCKYIILNTDLNKSTDFQPCPKIPIITYGLNSKATVTVSSITDNNIMIYIQRNIQDREGNIQEVGEKRIQIKEETKLKTYEILIIVTIFILNNQKIMEEI